MRQPITAITVRLGTIATVAQQANIAVPLLSFVSAGSIDYIVRGSVDGLDSKKL